MRKIGVLCPYSSIYPNMHIDFLNGLRLALPSDHLLQYEFFEEFIANGSETNVRSALEKLLFFRRVDLVTGFCNYKILDVLLDLTDKFDAVSMMADMGEIIPAKQIMTDKILFNSLSLWQTEYALGAWAQMEYGKRGKGMIIMSSYEAGYHFHTGFIQGVASVEEVDIEVSIIPQNRVSREVMKEYIRDYVKMIKKQSPAYVHAIFAGQEAIDFIGIYAESGIDKEVPLLVSSHMSSQEILNHVRGGDIQMFSTDIWNTSRDNKENQAFVKGFFSQYGEMPNTFNLLGYEVGLAIRETHGSLQSKDWIKMNQLLKKTQLRTPRGEKLFGWDEPNNSANISIERVIGCNGDFKRMELKKVSAISPLHLEMTKIIQENVSGFLNPYLCI